MQGRFKILFSPVSKLQQHAVALVVLLHASACSINGYIAAAVVAAHAAAVLAAAVPVAAAVLAAAVPVAAAVLAAAAWLAVSERQGLGAAAAQLGKGPLL